MSQVECECGRTYRLTRLYDPIPNQGEGWLAFKPRDFAELLEEASTAPDRSALEKAMNQVPRRVLIECDRCGRLLWEQPDAVGVFVFHR